MWPLDELTGECSLPWSIKYPDFRTGDLGRLLKGNGGLREKRHSFSAINFLTVFVCIWV